MMKPAAPGPEDRRLRRRAVIRRFAVMALSVLAAAAVAGALWRWGPVAVGWASGQNTRPSWWRVGLHDSALRSVAATPSMVIAASETSVLYAIGKPSGKTRWTARVGTGKPSAPAVAGGTVFVTTDGGDSYAIRLNDGATVWHKRWGKQDDTVSAPVVGGGVVYAVIRTDLVAAAAATGEIVWRLGLTSPHLRGPVLTGRNLYLADEDGRIVAVDTVSRTVVWKSDPIPRMASLGCTGNVVVAGTEAAVIALNATTGKRLWKYDPGSPVWNVTVSERNIGILTGTGFSVVAPSTGTVVWQLRATPERYTMSSADGSSFYLARPGGMLSRYDAQTGHRQWIYRAPYDITVPPGADGSDVYFADATGAVYAIGKSTGEPAARPVPAVTQSLQSVPKYGIVELSLKMDDTVFSNPQTDVSFTAVFLGKNQEDSVRYQVRGFYYAHNEWRIRFSPPYTGTWTWTVYGDGRAIPSATGSFSSSDNGATGPLSVHPVNPYRLVDARNTPFIPVGINIELTDTNGNGNPFDDVWLDGTQVQFGQYVREFAGSGFNIARWGIGNASFSPYDASAFASPQIPKTTESGWMDDGLSVLRQNGMKTMLTLFGHEAPFSGEKDTDYLAPGSRTRALMEDYIRYIVARYGVYTDIWELSNFKIDSQAWVDLVTDTVRREDPYHKPVAIGDERWGEADNRITVISPHWYDTEPETESDSRTATNISGRRWGKPFMFGEQGNMTVNWDERSDTRMRIRTWTTVFEEAGIIFWNRAQTKTFSEQPARIYIGKTARMNVQSLRTFLERVGTDTRSPKLIVHPDSREYRMTGIRRQIGYVVHASNHDTDTTVSVTLPKTATGIEWYDPESGKTLAQATYEAGKTPVSSVSPQFSVDIAYIVVMP